MRLSKELELLADHTGDMARSAKVTQPPPKKQIARRSTLEQATPETKRRAISRYLADEVAAANRNTPSGVKPAVRWDVVLLRHAAWSAINIYEMITSFVGYHLGGVITRAAWRRRADFCERCTFRKRRYSGARPAEPVPVGFSLNWQDKCHGPGTGKPCGCPKDLAWKPSALKWKLWLRLFRCPCGYWDRGGYVPAPPPGDAPIGVSLGSCGSCGA